MLDWFYTTKVNFVLVTFILIFNFIHPSQTEEPQQDPWLSIFQQFSKTGATGPKINKI